MTTDSFAIIELDHWLEQCPSRSYRSRWAGVWYATLWERGVVVGQGVSSGPNASREQAVAAALDDAEEGRVAA